MKQFDDVKQPSHYTDREIEVIDFIRDTLSAEQFEGYCLGNAIKYISRWDKKHNTRDKQEQDIDKAIWYLNTLLREG